MKKTEMVARVANEADITKQAAQAAVGAVFASIAEALARGEDVPVAGFGRFFRKDRPAREGRNPRTGERMAVGPLANGRQRTLLHYGLDRADVGETSSGHVVS